VDGSALDGITPSADRAEAWQSRGCGRPSSPPRARSWLRRRMIGDPEMKLAVRPSPHRGSAAKAEVFPLGIADRPAAHPAGQLHKRAACSGCGLGQGLDLLRPGIAQHGFPGHEVFPPWALPTSNNVAKRLLLRFFHPWSETTCRSFRYGSHEGPHRQPTRNTCVGSPCSPSFYAASINSISI
jgi:hypothetical protein